MTFTLLLEFLLCFQFVFNFTEQHEALDSNSEPEGSKLAVNGLNERANYKRFLIERRVPYSVSEDEAHLNWDCYFLSLFTVMHVSSPLTHTVCLW